VVPVQRYEVPEELLQRRGGFSQIKPRNASPGMIPAELEWASNKRKLHASAVQANTR